jgi:hypothetical protein
LCWLIEPGSTTFAVKGRAVSVPLVSTSFAGFWFPPDVILLAVRWYLRYGLSYRDVEELLAERGVDVDHVTVYRWVQRFTPLLVDAARRCRHVVGDRWFVDTRAWRSRQDLRRPLGTGRPQVRVGLWFVSPLRHPG